VPVDVVPWSADLRRYKLVLAPAFYVLLPAAVPHLRRYAERGGTLLFDVRTGVKDPSNRVVESPLPGPVAELCGMTVEEYDALDPAARVPLVFGDEPCPGVEALQGQIWCDVLALQGARALARYGGQHYAGEPAATVNAVGCGKVLYIGTIGNAAAYDALTGWLLEKAGLQPLLATPPASRRRRAGRAGSAGSLSSTIPHPHRRSTCPGSSAAS